MNMITHYPINNRLFSDFDRLVNQAFGATPEDCCEAGDCSPVVEPSIDNQSEDEGGWKLRFELPGYRKGEVKVSTDAEYLHIVAETEDEGRSFLTKQERQIRISDELDTAGISAKLEDGILFLEIPRRVKEQPVDIVIN